MPQIVYHFQSKGRDEARPRAGVLRAREFAMKDAYSFDVDQAGLERRYAAEHGAYARTFERMGLDAISVESDTGAMGGDIAHEFQVLTEVGAERIAVCPNCAYRANLERATTQARIENFVAAENTTEPSEVETPAMTSTEQLEASRKAPPAALLKTLLMRDAKTNVVAVVLPD